MSDTQNIVDKAGRDNETAYQLTKAARELKRDFESVAAGGSLEESAMIANYAAGAVVGKVGTSTATVSEILSLMDNE